MNGVFMNRISAFSLVAALTALLSACAMAPSAPSPSIAEKQVAESVFGASAGAPISYEQVKKAANLENYVWHTQKGHDLRQIGDSWGKSIGYSVDWRAKAPMVGTKNERVFVGNYFDAVRDLVGGGIERAEIADDLVCIGADGFPTFLSAHYEFKLDVQGKRLIVSDLPPKPKHF